jgi:TonB family protein
MIVFLTLFGALAQTTPPGDGAQAGGPKKPAPCRGKVEAPRPVVTPDPQRPKDSSRGIVVISCVIGADGRVHEPRVVRRLSPEADKNALAVIEKWEFKPATCDGSPYAVRMSVEVLVR